MRMIDADALRDNLQVLAYDDWNQGVTTSWADAFREVADMVEEMPTIERKKGKWIIKAVNTFELAYGSTGYEPVYECSICGGVEESYLRLDEPIMPDDADFPNYCPSCGARMER